MYIDEKVKKELRERLEAIVDQQYAKSDFIDLQVLDLMRETTQSTGFEVAVVINRRGIIENVFVGDKTSVQFSTSSNKVRGLNGLRVIHTHPTGDSRLSRLDKSALTNSLYDCLVAVGVSSGELTTATAGFVRVQDDGEYVTDEVFLHNANYINKYGLLEKIYEYDKDFKATESKLHENAQGNHRAVLVMAEITKEDDLVADLDELENLANTVNIKVVNRVTQKRAKPDPKYYIGHGKLQELKNAVQNYNANLVIFDNVLTGTRQANLVQELGVDVIDRSRLILDIFAKRAKSNEGKLQVELAQLRYLLPRVANLSRNTEGSGIGLRGPGETKIELNRRVVQNNILKLEKELENVKRNRRVARDNRMKSQKPIVSFVGYTNSGKSTLMNALSGAGVYEKDELFATLDTTTRNVWLNDKNEILLIDTVGFINKLPHEFVAAFSSTLEESVFANLLLHVVDSSNKNWQKQYEVVLKVLNEIGAHSKIITVFNKIDKIKDKDLTEIKKLAPENSVFVSAKTGRNLEQLKNIIIKNI